MHLLAQFKFNKGYGMPKNDWNEYKKLLLNEFSENKKFRDAITIVLGTMREDISSLKVKAAVAGGLAGMVGTGVVSMILSAFK